MFTFLSNFCNKRNNLKDGLDVKYVGFEIPDEFVVGYGMDYDERFRTFADIGILKEEFINS